MVESSLTTRNVRVDGRRTSVRLEPELWRALETIADLEETSVNALCEHVHGRRRATGGFTSALRVFIVEYFGEAVRRDSEIERTNAPSPSLATDLDVTTDDTPPEPRDAAAPAVLGAGSGAACADL